jgi:hypothetical protein
MIRVGLQRGLFFHNPTIAPQNEKVEKVEKGENENLVG